MTLKPSAERASVPIEEILETVEGLIRRRRFLASSERELQIGIANMLRKEGIPFEDEKRLGARDRLDFLVAGRLAMEVKRRREWSLASVREQVERYLSHASVEGLLLVASAMDPRVLIHFAKPVHVVVPVTW